MNFVYYIPVLIFSIVIHEVAHGWVAMKCGDSTAKDLGRITLNPIPHLDPIGSVLIPLLGYFSGGFLIGWAKPVPVNPLNFRNWKRDDILVTIAGPFSNIMLTSLFTILAIVVYLTAASIQPVEGTASELVFTFLYNMFIAGIQLNVILAIFNMLPIPPLDGSHILANFLPEQAAIRYRQIGFFGIFILLLLFNYVPGFAQAFYSIIEAGIKPFMYLVHTFTT